MQLSNNSGISPYLVEGERSFIWGQPHIDLPVLAWVATARRAEKCRPKANSVGGHLGEGVADPFFTSWEIQGSAISCSCGFGTKPPTKTHSGHKW